MIYIYKISLENIRIAKSRNHNFMILLYLYNNIIYLIK